MRLGAQPFLWKWVLFAWAWKMISISKAEHLPSFWNRGPEELGNGLLIARAHSRTRPALVTTTFSNFWDGRLLELQRYFIRDRHILQTRSSLFEYAVGDLFSFITPGAHGLLITPSIKSKLPERNHNILRWCTRQRRKDCSVDLPCERSVPSSFRLQDHPMHCVWIRSATICWREKPKFLQQ